MSSVTDQMMFNETFIQLKRGLEFQPSHEMKKIKGVTWANDEKHHWYVASFNGTPVACVGMFTTDSTQGLTARFKTDVVVPEHRGKGLYSLLFGLRETLAMNLGVVRATTFSNKQSRHQYEKAGFKAAGGENAAGVLYMIKELAKPIKSW